MLENLNNDMLQYIGNFLDLQSLGNLISINNKIKNILDEQWFENYGIEKYGKEFWIKAKLRPIKKSKPLNSMFKELKRIEIFQYKLERYNFKQWIKEDFYEYWKKE